MKWIQRNFSISNQINNEKDNTMKVLNEKYNIETKDSANI